MNYRVLFAASAAADVRATTLVAHAALGTHGALTAELGTHRATTLVAHTALGTHGALAAELGTHGALTAESGTHRATTLVAHTTLGTHGALTALHAFVVMATTMLVGVFTGVLAERFANVLALLLIDLTVLVHIKLVHELSTEILTDSLALLLIDLAILVHIELGHELSLASLHEGSTITTRSGRCGCRCNFGGRSNFGCRCSRCSRGNFSSRGSLLCNERHAGDQGENKGFLHFV